jgi:hypothetical protein
VFRNRGDVDEGEALRYVHLCDRCIAGEMPYQPKPDIEEWLHHKATDLSWEAWRQEQKKVMS